MSQADIDRLIQSYRKRGGLTRRAFCEQRGMTPSALDYYLRRYGKPAPSVTLARVELQPAEPHSFARSCCPTGRRVECGGEPHSAALIRDICPYVGCSPPARPPKSTSRWTRWTCAKVSTASTAWCATTWARIRKAATSSSSPIAPCTRLKVLVWDGSRTLALRQASGAAGASTGPPSLARTR